jgi:tetratricopeptide (TPR) repeat protein
MPSPQRTIQTGAALQVLSGLTSMAVAVPLWWVTSTWFTAPGGWAMANWFLMLVPTGLIVVAAALVTLLAPQKAPGASLFALGIQLVSPLFGAIHEPWVGIVVVVLRVLARRQDVAQEQDFTRLTCGPDVENTDLDSVLSKDQVLHLQTSLLRSQALNLVQQGRREEAIPLLEQTVELGRLHGPAAEATALRNVASVSLTLGVDGLKRGETDGWKHVADSLSAALKARDLLARNPNGDPIQEARIYMLIGSAYSYLHEYEAARDAYRLALQLRRQVARPEDPVLQRIQRSLAEVALQVTQNPSSSLRSSAPG